MAYVYILRCVGGALYTGITSDIERRLREHLARSGVGAKYTRSHPAEAVAALWELSDLRLAARVEWRIKHWSSEKKRALVLAPERLGSADFPLPDGIAPHPLPLPPLPVSAGK